VKLTERGAAVLRQAQNQDTMAAPPDAERKRPPALVESGD
jgi:hypothetical protein